MLPQADHSWTIFEAAHLLNRAGFGGSPSEVKKFHALGRVQAVESLLKPTEPLDAFPMPAWSSGEQALAGFKSRREQFRGNMKEMRNLSREEREEKKREAIKEAQQESRRQGLEAQGWWFGRMLATQAPLREKMTLFWHDHFATSIQKVKQPVLLMIQNDLFRQNALGSFKDLTQAILLDPAMLFYLDSQNSRKGMPNENFAREVMELFALGEGNYTEQDIREAARAFTGYQLDFSNGTVKHRESQWDSSEKTIFAKTGPFDGKDVINLIFEKKEAASFMANKLWEFFVYEKPSEAALRALTEIFHQGGFQVAPLLREIFLSKEFYSEATIRSQIKSPVQYLVTLLKQLEIRTPPVGFPITGQSQLGQILFMPPNVAGWDWGQAWINTNTLLTRYNLAGFLTKGIGSEANMVADEKTKIPRMGGIKNMGTRWQGPDYENIAPRALRENPDDLVDSLIFRFFQSPVPDAARKSFIEFASSKKGAVFTNTETAELCHLILSTPYYQLC